MSVAAASVGRRYLERLVLLGVDPADDEELRLQKVTLTIAAITVTVLSVVWVGNVPRARVARLGGDPVRLPGRVDREPRRLRPDEGLPLLPIQPASLIFILPFLLQWSLGGYVASSAVSLWALVGAFGALFFYSARAAIPWFVAFLALTALSGLLEPIVSSNPASIPVGGPDRFLRPQHLWRGVDRLPPPAVRGSGKGRRACELGAAAPEHPAEVDRRSAEETSRA